MSRFSSVRCWCVSLWLLSGVLGGGAALAAPATLPAVRPTTLPVLARPTERTKDCTAGGCHVAVKQFKQQHGPVAVGACDACHNYADEKQHTFVLREAKETLCTFCHIGGGGPAGTVTHKPFADGQCLSCHNPHGGASRMLLRKEEMASLCADCHGDVTKHRKYLHGPVASGSCSACHNSHRAPFPKLLAAKGRDLCLGCHDQMGQQMKLVKAIHKPVEGECSQCHEIHASDHKMHLKQAPADLCGSCHEPIKKLVAEATFKHSAATTGEACLSCHTAHGSDLSKLMKSAPAKACLSCHDKAIAVSKDRTIPAVATIADTKQNKHGPIRDGDCSGCHMPHGGPVSRLLSKPYPETFYQSFDLEKYGLCFSCHDKQLALLEKTKGLTGFRNGEQNLHYLHVNKTDKGRNCRACHNTHTSTLPVHLRETVPFGKWEMPINFKTTSTGGSCKPGCHEEYAYDRERPVPAAAPKSALAKESK